MLTAKSGMPLRVYDYLEGKIFMGALLSTEYVSGREGRREQQHALSSGGQVRQLLGLQSALQILSFLQRPRMLVENLPPLILEF